MPYNSKFQVLLVGGSGYLGGSILVAIIKKYPEAELTVLARSDKHDARLLVAGVAHIVHIAVSDTLEARRAAFNADIIINAADSDDLVLVRFLINGLAERKRATGKRGILIHTSGTALVFDDATGDFDPALKPINDTNEDEIASIHPLAMHRKVDNEIFAADEAGNISGYIIAPSIIWGQGRGPVKQVSGMFPVYLAMARAFKRGIIIGDGTALAATVHIDDVVSLQLLVLARALARQDLGASPYSKFYFASTREQSQRDILEPMAKYFYEAKVFPSPTLERITYSDAIATHPYSFVLARNTYVKAERGIANGWKPVHFGSMTAPEVLAWALDTSLQIAAEESGVQKQYFGVSASV